MMTSRARRPDSGIPDVLLERYHLGELAPDATRHLDVLLAEDHELRARLDALSAADAHAHGVNPPGVLARNVRERLAHERRSWPPRRRLLWAVPVGAAALMTVTIGLGSLSPAVDRPRQDVRPVAETSGDATGTAADGRAKGADVALLVYRATDAGATLLADGDVAQAGDVVRVGYRAGRPGFGTIVSVDGRGAVTQHWPDGGTRAVALEPGATVLLDRGFELDDAPRVERFFLVAADDPFDLAPVMEALRRVGSGTAVDVGALGLPASFTTTAFSLWKDARP